MPKILDDRTVVICDESWEEFGCGFHLGHGYIVTCAHVINSVLGKKDNHPSKPNDSINLRFLTNLSPRLEAKVVAWTPLDMENQSGDVAILQLIDAPQEYLDEAVIELLTNNDTLEGKKFTVRGTTQNKYNAPVAVKGEVLSTLASTRWIQLDADLTRNARRIVSLEAYSGAAIWVSELDTLAGILTHAHESHEIVHMIPSSYIVELLEEHELLGWSKQKARFDDSHVYLSYLPHPGDSDELQDFVKSLTDYHRSRPERGHAVFETLKHIGDCGVVVAVMNQAALENPQLETEWEIALMSGRAIIIIETTDLNSKRLRDLISKGYLFIERLGGQITRHNLQRIKNALFTIPAFIEEYRERADSKFISHQLEMIEVDLGEENCYPLQVKGRHKRPSTIQVEPWQAFEKLSLAEAFRKGQQAADKYPPIAFLLGDLGSGKTLLLANYLRDSLWERFLSPTAPLPIWVNAREWLKQSSRKRPFKTNLNNWLLSLYEERPLSNLHLKYLDQKHLKGAVLLLLDGLDELPYDSPIPTQSPLSNFVIYLQRALTASVDTSYQLLLSCRSSVFAENLQDKFDYDNSFNEIYLHDVESSDIQEFLRDEPELASLIINNTEMRELAKYFLHLSLLRDIYRSFRQAQRNNIVALAGQQPDPLSLIRILLVTAISKHLGREKDRFENISQHAVSEILKWLEKMAILDLNRPQTNNLQKAEIDRILPPVVDIDDLIELLKPLRIITKQSSTVYRFHHSVIRDYLVLNSALENPTSAHSEDLISALSRLQVPNAYPLEVISILYNYLLNTKAAAKDETLLACIERLRQFSKSQGESFAAIDAVDLEKLYARLLEIALNESLSEALRRQAANLLPLLPVTQNIEELDILSQSADMILRHAAYHALALSKDVQGLWLLMRHLSEITVPDEDIEAICAHVNDTWLQIANDLNPILVQHLKTTQRLSIRIAAIKALGQIGDVSVVQSLLLTLNEPDLRTITELTLLSMASRNDPEIIAILIEALPQERDLLVRILNQIAEESEVVSQRVQAFISKADSMNLVQFREIVLNFSPGLALSVLVALNEEFIAVKRAENPDFRPEAEPEFDLSAEAQAAWDAGDYAASLRFLQESGQIQEFLLLHWQRYYHMRIKAFIDAELNNLLRATAAEPILHKLRQVYQKDYLVLFLSQAHLNAIHERMESFFSLLGQAGQTDLFDFVCNPANPADLRTLAAKFLCLLEARLKDAEPIIELLLQGVDSIFSPQDAENFKAYLWYLVLNAQTLPKMVGIVECIELHGKVWLQVFHTLPQKQFQKQFLDYLTSDYSEKKAVKAFVLKAMPVSQGNLLQIAEQSQNSETRSLILDRVKPQNLCKCLFQRSRHNPETYQFHQEILEKLSQNYLYHATLIQLLKLWIDLPEHNMNQPGEEAINFVEKLEASIKRFPDKRVLNQLMRHYFDLPTPQQRRIIEAYFDQLESLTLVPALMLGITRKPKVADELSNALAYLEKRIKQDKTNNFAKQVLSFISLDEDKNRLKFLGLKLSALSHLLEYSQVDEERIEYLRQLCAFAFNEKYDAQIQEAALDALSTYRDFLQENYMVDLLHLLQRVRPGVQIKAIGLLKGNKHPRPLSEFIRLTTLPDETRMPVVTAALTALLSYEPLLIAKAVMAQQQNPNIDFERFYERLAEAPIDVAVADDFVHIEEKRSEVIETIVQELLR